MKKNDWMLVAATLTYSYLFYEELAGINFLLFTIVLIVALIIQDKSVVNNKIWNLLAIGSLVTAASIAYYNNYLCIIANVIALGILSGYSIKKYNSIIFSLFFSIYTALTAFYFIIFDFVNRIRKNNEIIPAHQSRNILLIIVPIVISIIFFFMYRNANPLFDNLMNQINFDFISGKWIIFTSGGLLLCYGFFYHKNLTAIAAIDKNGKNNLENTKQKPLELFGKEISILDELFSGKLMFILLNILLVVVNLLDANFLFVNHKLPDGISASQFVHQGTNTIIGSIIFAILIILFYFRGSLNFYKNSNIIKWLAYTWIAQNVFLLVSTLIRNNIYVVDLGLTYKRIGVYIYLGLCIIGLLLTVIKIAKVKSNHFLFRVNAWVFYTVLVLSCLVNWDCLITEFNSTKAKHVEKKYLLQLSFTNIPDLLKLKNDTLSENLNNKLSGNLNENSSAYFAEKLDNKIYLFLQDRKMRTWKSWYADNDRVYKYWLKSFKEGSNSSLTLSNNYLSSIEYLPELASLQSLNISLNIFNSLSSITPYKNLHRLNISRNYIVDLSGIENFTLLEYLDVSGNAIDDYAPIYKLTNLQQLKVSSNISKKELDLLKSNVPRLQILF